MQTEDALVFTTGYQANLGCLSTILGPSDTVIADSSDHASILDGCKLSGARLRPFRHKRMDKLETMLERAAGDGGGVLVVVDGVFSMEGDVCDLPEVVELCRSHGARLMVDEAHAVGVLGRRGAGASELHDVEDEGGRDVAVQLRHLERVGTQTHGAHHLDRRTLERGTGHDRGDGDGAIARVAKRRRALPDFTERRVAHGQGGLWRDLRQRPDRLERGKKALRPAGLPRRDASSRPEPRIGSRGLSHHRLLRKNQRVASPGRV